ncbi:MAG: ABC transporter permease [Syntrophobacterales bacterium]
MTKIFRQFGRVSLSLVQEAGGMTIFLLEGLGLALVPPFRFRRLFQELYLIGVRSIPIILLTAAFTGMVMALQGYYTLRQYGSEGALGAAGALSLIREMGPVLTGIMVSARLTAMFDVMGILGGYLVGVVLLGVSSGTYFATMVQSVVPLDINGGIVKSLVFGITVVLVACYKGYNTEHGAEGVSRATNQTVVLSAVLVLAWDYLLTSFFM